MDDTLTERAAADTAGGRELIITPTGKCDGRCGIGGGG